MFKINVVDTDVSLGSIKISWCVDKELINYLAEQEIKNPCVVIVTAPTGSNYALHKEHRMVVPLMDLVGYLEVHSAGEVQILGFVSDESEKITKRLFLERTHSEYYRHLLVEDGSDWADNIKNMPDLQLRSTAEPVLLTVPDGIFAKTPPEWFSNWVNFYFDNLPLDQCTLRRRTIFAFTLQPIWVLLKIIWGLLAVILSATIGSRNCNFNNILHPLSTSMADMFLNCFGNGTIFIRRLPEEKDENWAPDTTWDFIWYLVKKAWPLPFMPSILCLGFCVWHFHLIFRFLVLVGIAVAILAVIVTFVFMVECWDELIDAINKCWDNLLGNQIWYENKEDIDLLSCERGINSYNNLPSKKKTIKLRYLETKSKICKPFAK